MKGKPWQKHYDTGVPTTLQPYPNKTLLDIVSETVQQRPDHPALFFKGRQLSYKQIEKLSDTFASSLVDLGVKKGDRIALLLANCPQFIITQMGVWKAGCIAVPINPVYSERELEHALNECGAEIAVVMTSSYDKVKKVQHKTDLHCLITTNIKEYLPIMLRILFTFFKEKKGGHRIVLGDGAIWLRALLHQYDKHSRPDISVKPEDPALIIFTGGTTGTPKGALGTHASLVMTSIQLHTWFGVLLKDWDDIIMLAMPLFHMYGNLGILGTGLVGHNPLVLVPDPRDIGDIIFTINKVRPAFIPAVPTLLNTLLNHPEVKSGSIDFKSVKLCISAAAPLMSETKKNFEELTHGRVVEAYGLTESMLAAVITPLQGTYKNGSVGIPLPDVDVRVVDVNTDKGNLPAGEVGEIVVSAPQLMQGYWQRPAETAETIRGGWLYTGDIGYLDEDGYIFIVDRKKDVIKPSGFQVWPREVEEVIASHPAVIEVGVAGIPDERQGEAVKAWIVLRKDYTVSIDEIRNYCRENLTAYKVPKYVELCDSLPKSMVGKVLRRELVSESLKSKS
ncbi:MAG TPA: long-chain fatty acid--CoA ligase [Dehalococcoidia bacterium]|nr:long-chain fatty acid--CoA ligase [Dehalococcoidia bacterium]